MAENDVNRLIDMLYERVEDAKSPALKPNLSMVDRDEISVYYYYVITCVNVRCELRFVLSS